MGYDFYNNERKPGGQQELPQDFSAEYMEFALNQSLKRLKTDYIDLYQLHNSRIDVIQRDDVIATLQRFKQEGKILSFGVALGPAIAERQIDEGKAAIEKKFAGVQIIYNLIEQMLGKSIFPAAAGSKSSILVRVPHASGLLDGTVEVKTEFKENDHRYHRVSTDERKRQWQEEGLKKIEQLKFLAEGTGRSLGQAAIQFILRESVATSIFPNIYNERLLEEFAKAPETPELSDAEFSRVQELVEANFLLQKTT